MVKSSTNNRLQIHPDFYVKRESIAIYHQNQNFVRNDPILPSGVIVLASIFIADSWDDA